MISMAIIDRFTGEHVATDVTTDHPPRVGELIYMPGQGERTQHMHVWRVEQLAWNVALPGSRNYSVATKKPTSTGRDGTVSSVEIIVTPDQGPWADESPAERMRLVDQSEGE